MRAKHGDATRNLFAAFAFQLFEKSAADLLQRNASAIQGCVQGQGILAGAPGQRVKRRLVFETQHLLAASQVAVHTRRRPLEFLDRLDARLDDVGAQFNQFFIPVCQLPGIAAAFRQLPEQGIALGHHPPILG